MLSQLSVITHTIGSRPYNFLCSPDSPLVEIKEALFQFNKYIADIEDKAKIQAEEAAKSKAEEDKVENENVG